MANGSGPVWETINNLRRYPAEGKIAGICEGLSRSTPLAAWAWRVLFLISLLFGGAGLFVYIVLWIFMPVQENEKKQA